VLIRILKNNLLDRRLQSGPSSASANTNLNVFPCLFFKLLIRQTFYCIEEYNISMMIKDSRFILHADNLAKIPFFWV
jgi:hypothetical protein